MKTVLVGGSGFLGRHLACALLAQGHACRVLSRNPWQRSGIRDVIGVDLRAADVYDPDELVSAFEGADAVFSMAGILNERGNSGKGFQRVHVELVDTIIAAARSAGVARLMHVSALNAGQGTSNYLLSKGEGEDRVRASGLEWSIFQPSVIFGPGDSFFNRFAALLRISPVLPLACPKAQMQPVYSGDVCNIMTSMLDEAGSVGGTFELGGPGQYSLQELVRWTGTVCGHKRPVPGLPNFLSRLQGFLMDYVPGKPFSSDNYRSLQVPNVTSNNALPAAGIKPTAIDQVVPAYLGVSPHQRRLDDIRRGFGE